jgi:hypothetical protein
MSFRWKSRRWEKYALVKISSEPKPGAANGAAVEASF